MFLTCYVKTIVNGATYSNQQSPPHSTARPVCHQTVITDCQLNTSLPKLPYEDIINDGMQIIALLRQVHQRVNLANNVAEWTQN